jgi:hypothetical protein
MGLSPAKSFSDPTPARLMTIFYCLKFEAPPTWRARSPYLCSPGTEWPSYIPRHWVPFSSSPTTRKAGQGGGIRHGKSSDLLRLNHYRIKIISHINITDKS